VNGADAKFLERVTGAPRDPWIGALFGADVATASCATDQDASAFLHPDEAAHSAGFAAKRRREFAAGRDCARRLLVSLGLPSTPIGVDAHRAPRWPDGVVGSISHGAGLCVVAVARRGSILGLGVDVESEAPLSEGIRRRVCTDGERRHLEVLGEPEAGRRAKLLFSIKEAVYKCVHPLVQTPIGFQQAEVQLDLTASRFRVRPIGTSAEVAERLAAAEGCFAWRCGRVLSGATLRAPDAAHGTV
jgi:4'-phosphopantetheinyl transferase EntD